MPKFLVGRPNAPGAPGDAFGPFDTYEAAREWGLSHIPQGIVIEVHDPPGVAPTPEPGDSAHKWALDGPPIRNSASGTTRPMLDCPVCGDVILDVVKLQSGPLDVPRNLYSPLGLVWYARCPECGWTSPDRPSEWTLLEAVNEARN